MTEIDGVRLPFLPAGGIDELRKQPTPNQRTSSEVSFRDIFQDELNKLKFSAHAQARLSSREISLSEEDVARLQNAVSMAEEKGAGDSLILLDDKAFIVNVPNKTVITVMNNSNNEDRIVTNIDSAVIA
ncbi:MAG: hypothetical protein QG635_122 [Bacteroidota bacterium]|nr:hypothetical protein [Bacteroidota bacterium]